jgi:aryl-alcohol dehydrogenase-like predicted oxidoreductase
MIPATTHDRKARVATRLGLGTVQFGMKYGIANARGRTGRDDVRAIIAMAARNDIRVLDTAAAYGESEAVLGDCLDADARWCVVTKTPPLKAHPDADARDVVRSGLMRSLDRLRLPSLYGLLAHHAADLLGPQGEAIYSEMRRLKDEGRVGRIGLSAYRGEEIDAALARFDIDLVQVPINVLDQRLISGGQIERLKRRGVEIHVRSVFLQGLLLLVPSALPGYFEPIRRNLEAWRSALQGAGLSPAQGALSFAASIGADVVLVGVDGPEQLATNIHDISFGGAGAVDFSRFALNDEKYVNPSCWQLN